MGPFGPLKKKNLTKEKDWKTIGMRGCPLRLDEVRETASVASHGKIQNLQLVSRSCNHATSHRSLSPGSSTMINLVAIGNSFLHRDPI
jgi:hypothetical protein